MRTGRPLRDHLPRHLVATGSGGTTGREPWAKEYTEVPRCAARHCALAAGPGACRWRAGASAGRRGRRSRSYRPCGALVSDLARQQLATIRDEWLTPLIARMGDLERENGRLEAERDEQRRRAGARA